MADDQIAASGSPLTRAEWRALRRIRRLQTAHTMFFAAGLAGILMLLIAFMRELMISAEIRGNYYSPWEAIGFGAMAVAFAGEGIISELLNRSICPSCGHGFFGLAPHLQETGRRSLQRTSARARLTRVARQQCGNCGLSLGMAATPEPAESAGSRG